MSIGTTNISFSDLKTKYQSKSGVISGTEIRASDFRGALFTDRTFILDNDDSISINYKFKGKTFSDKPYLYHYYDQGSWNVSDSDSYMHTFTSNNHTDSSYSWYYLVAMGNGNIRIKMNVSSEEDYDFGSLYIDGNVKLNKSGSYNGSSTDYAIKANQTVDFFYTKDGSTSEGNDEAIFTVDYYHYGTQGGFPTTLSVES
tara:strand:+ start:9563 stop:10162 length:600 start_codon:yes stop_codon:yes gene_type:complete